MQPAEGIRFIHAAICREVREIEDQADTAESPEQLTALGQRVAQFGAIVRAHTDGEEASMYPELDQRLRHVGAAYIHDHHEEQELFADLGARIGAAREASAATRADTLRKMRRQSIALTEHLLPHVRKEDTLITPLLVELFTPAEQGAHIGKMMGKFPPELLARAMPWLVASIEPEDRVTYVQMIRGAMPPERFAVACGWIKGGVAADVWSGITAKIPDLP